jgi:predicted DNA-binding transcriptional regulator AlpA
MSGMPTSTTPAERDAALLNQGEAARLLGLRHPRTLAAWRLRRQGPAYVRIGTSVRYRRADLEAYIEAQRVDPSSAPIR